MAHLSEEELTALALVFGEPTWGTALVKFRVVASELIPRFPRAANDSKFITVALTLNLWNEYRDWYQKNQEMLAGRGRTPDPPNGGSHTA